MLSLTSILAYGQKVLSFKDNGTTEIPTRWNGSCDGAGEDFNSSLCKYKLIGARYFNGGLKKERWEKMKSKESARDSIGHGTLVSSITVGNYANGASYFGYGKGAAKGITPHALLAVYKVLWSEGMSSLDIIAAIDQAVSDGVDVISLSIGNPNVQFSRYIRTALLHENVISIASFSAMGKGIPVVCSGGNEGPLFGTVDNGFPWLLTVAAGTTNRLFAGVLTQGNGVNITGRTLFPGTTSLQNLALLFNNEHPSCDKKANVTGAILISKNITSLEFEHFLCPCIVVSSKEADLVIDYAKYGTNPSASIMFQQTIIRNGFAPAVAWYSSRGPSRTYKHILTPDVMAPGSFILGARHPKQVAGTIGLEADLYNDYLISSGTSFACPHVTGVVALLKAKYPKWSPAAIGSAIMTTANPIDNTKRPIRDNGKDHQVASPLAMGAGHIDPNEALDPGSGSSHVGGLGSAERGGRFNALALELRAIAP
ncbi:hypothetical protein FNV43_RR20324 [Rhamnella rubrinervis]|uniref:Peptidase S8/S53 domain-containing protein n=1 Tax=Rhamnella rubrinervis TaxID=2594499 RepID=A0A8K0E059_9ROSA|nr:hypothetical protein FNV43_RR20324 [Rhamnella rubrinervis]